MHAKKKKSKAQKIDSCPPGCKVFMGNVPFHTTEKEIEDMVEELLGSDLISTVNIPRGAKSGRPFGYIFVDFKDPDVAQDFVDQADGLLFFAVDVDFLQASKLSNAVVDVHHVVARLKG